MPSYRVPRGGTIIINIPIRQRQASAGEPLPNEPQRQPLFTTHPPDDMPASIMSKVKLIISFTSNKTAISHGEQVTFSFQVTGHTTQLILHNVTAGSDIDLTSDIPSGSRTVTPPDPPSGQSQITYRLIADGSYGHHEENAIVITFNACNNINSFTATPTQINYGQSVQLAWSLQPQVTSANIQKLPSSTPINVSPPPSSGTFTFVPSPEPPNDQTEATYTYRLSATSSCTATSDVQVRVLAAQSVISYSVTDNHIVVGESVTFSYSCKHANRITITDLDTGVVTEMPLQAGSLQVTPPDTRTYRLTVYGNVAPVLRDIIITVDPA
jgi:hypothetical protein